MARSNSGKSSSSSKSKSTGKSSGKATKQQAAAVAPEPVVEATPAPVEATPAPVEATPAPAPAPAPAQVVEESSSDTTAETLESQFVAINTRLAELRALEASIVQDVSRLQKTAMKYIKEVSKKSRRRRAPPADGDKKRAPSGFAKPALISNELCTFLVKPQGT